MSEAQAKAEAAVALLPRPGSRWLWEPESAQAREHIVVTEVKWNGEEWWVCTEGVDGCRHWNSMGRFIEACIFQAPPRADGNPAKAVGARLEGKKVVHLLIRETRARCGQRIDPGEDELLYGDSVVITCVKCKRLVDLP